MDRYNNDDTEMQYPPIGSTDQRSTVASHMASQSIQSLYSFAIDTVIETMYTPPIDVIHGSWDDFHHKVREVSQQSHRAGLESVLDLYRAVVILQDLWS
jgi:hypothetical protein